MKPRTPGCYSDLLPRKIHGAMICQMLDSEGHRCTNRATREVAHHGDPEGHRGWICACLCEKHYQMYMRFESED